MEDELMKTEDFPHVEVSVTFRGKTVKQQGCHFIDAIADVGKDIWELMDDALTQYSDQYCADDYLKPVRFEGRIVA